MRLLPHLFFGCVLLAGCTTGMDRAEQYRSASLASGFCVLHKQPLRSVEAFKKDEDKDVYYIASAMNAYVKYPNAIPLGYLRSRQPGYSRKEIVMCCPVCDKLNQ
jgi:hypothetical protein